MFSDGVLALEKAGALDLGQPVIASFAFGGAELYGWMHLNPNVRMLRTETTNDPAQIAFRPAMISVNGALQVDLFAQANAGRVRGVIYPTSAGRPTSWSARCTRVAAARTSRCRRGTPRRTCPPWCPRWPAR
jgi:acyl-CoA hydrolase